MKRTVGYILVGLVAYVAFLALQFPAATFAGLLAQRLPGLAMGGVEGSAVAGAAEDLHLRGTRFDSVTWRWQPQGLLLGRLTYRVTAENDQLDVQGDIGTGWGGGLRVSDLSGQLALPRAIALLGRPPPPLDGELTLDLDELRLGANGLPQAAEGTAQLRNVRLALGSALNLGDFQVQVSTTDGDIVSVVKDQGGPLALDGTLTLSADGRYRFTGQLAPRETASQELGAALRALGRPGGDGQWRINYAGTL